MNVKILIDTHFCEYAFLKKVSDLLNHIKNYNLIITSNPYDIPYLDKNKTIVILTSDESGRLPCYRDSVYKIFRMYNRENLLHDNILPIPLGFCSYCEDVEQENNIEKDIDVIFLGQDTGTRNLMFESIEKSKYKIYLKCSGRHTFRQGVSTREYLNLMSRSKVSLVPDGFPNFETSRFSESFLFGCNVVTTNKPKFWYYENAPYYLVKEDWSNLDQVIDSCIESKDYSKNKKYYFDNLSPKAVATYIKNNIC